MHQVWDDYYKSHNYFRLEPHEALPGFLNECEKRGITDVLDLGCGAGADLLYMAERGYLVTGVDFSPAAVANAEDLLQSKDLQGKVYVDNLFDRITSFKPKEFNAIVAINSLQYTDINTFTTTITEAARTLSDHGLFLLVVSSKQSKLEVTVSEQLFFDQSTITSLVSKRFDILDFMIDSAENLTLTLEKISH